MVEDFSKDKMQKLVNIADSMFESGSSYGEIMTLLLKNGLTQYQATEIVKPIFLNKLQTTIKKQRNISIILTLAIIILVSLYFYGTRNNEAIALANIANNHLTPDKNGNYVVVSNNFRNYDFFMKVAVICALGLVFTLIRMLFNSKSLKEYN